MSETKQPLHTSIAPAADPAEHLPTTSWVPVPTPQSDAASGSFSLASQDEMLMPTPRLGSSSQKQGSSPDMCAIDAQPTTSSLSDHVSDELLQPGVQRQPDPSRDGISSTIASELTEPAVTTGRPHKLLADSIGEEDCQAEVWQDSGSTILLTNDLFQQLPDRSMAAQQSHQWQANDIFETQTSIAESTRAGRALSAASDQYSSVLISSSSSSLRHVDSSHVLKESAQSKQGTLEQHENTIDVDDSSSTPLVSACKQQHSTLQQQQVFSELFDTQLSQILTSQEDMFGSSAELPSSSQVADAEADSAPVLVAGSARGSTADLALDSILVSMRSTASGDAGVDSVQSSTQCHDLYRSTAAVATDAATAAATASESCAAFLLCMEHQEAMKREPLRAAVSTAQLEVMGWDMFTDTLGTFRLLSDTDSDVESTHNLLPEPSELGPVTPEAAEHQLAMNHGWYMENAPAVPYTTELSAFLDDFPGHSHIELIDSNVSVVPADKFVMDDHVSCLEREFQTVMSDRQGLVEAYPGMSSDAEEFDGDGSPGCLGQHASCAGRLEECVTCSPCATCSCYPYAALRPGKRHQKTKLKRVWARVRNMGDACLHPKFLHESYT